MLSIMISTLPIFPLPGLLLFPGAYLPLHIFEPRYRLLLNYCLENDEEIGITSLKKDGSLEPVFGWGKIIETDHLPDGRSNIMILGKGVAKLVRYKTREPFVISLVNKRENYFSHLRAEEFQEILLEILRLTKIHLHYMQAEESFLEELEKLKKHPFPIELITSFLDLKFEWKQDILSCENPYDKAELLLNFLNNLIKEQN